MPARKQFMIPDSAVEKLSENLTLKGILKFFIKHQNDLIYFHHVSKLPEVSVRTLVNFDKGELKLITTKAEGDMLLVIHTSKTVSESLLKNSAKVGSVPLRKVIDLATSLKTVNGIAVQCASCYFTIGLKELQDGLQSNA